MKVLFCMASGQTAPNINPLSEVAPDKVVVAITDGMRTKGEALMAEIRNTVGAVESLDITNESSLKALIEQFSKWLEVHIDDEIIINITGGTKLMSLAAYQVFDSWGFRCFYCDKDNSQLIWLDDETVISNIGSKIGLERYLRSYQFEIEKKQTLAAVEKSHKDYAQLLYAELSKMGKFDETCSIIGKINAHTSKKKIKESELKRFYFKKNELKFINMLKDRTELFKLSQGGIIKPIDESSRKLMSGGWLEVITADSLRDEKKIFRDISVGVEIAKSTQRTFNSTRQEIDVMAMREDKLIIIECKTKKWKTATEASSAIYKLSALRNTGGLNTQAIFVSLHDLPASAKTRAAEHGVGFVCGESDIKSLSRLLKQ